MRQASAVTSEGAFTTQFFKRHPGELRIQLRRCAADDADDD